MPVEIRVPSLGESIVDATIAHWLKHEGDAVKKDEPLVELETDKVNVEVPAPESGVLQKIDKHEDDVVAVGEILGVIGEQAGTAVSANGPAPAANQQPQQQQAGPEAPAETARPATPLAQRVAEANNVDLARVPAGTTGERVRKEDVENYIAKQNRPAAEPPQEQEPTQPVLPGPAYGAPSSEVVGSPAQRQAVASAPAPTQSAPAKTQAAPAAQPAAQAVAQPEQGTDRREERRRLSRRRQTIAQRLVETQHTAAMLTTFNEVDMTAIMDVRNRRKESFKERYKVSLGFMSFFTKAVVGGLKAFPQINSEIQSNELVIKHYYDIGIAVGTEEGLVVPVVRDAGRKSFAEIEQAIADLAQKARSNTLSLADLQGGTFTITNGGVYGSLLSTPILNGPQAGILGMHKIEQRPIALNGQVVIRPMMYIALSYDHRIVDGREAVQFLVRVKELLEDPETLLLEG